MRYTNFKPAPRPDNPPPIDPARGLLAYYPPDVVAVVNGHPITRADVLRGRRERQARALAWKRRNWEDVIKPAFIWVFYVPSFPFGPAWWTYIRTSKDEWGKRLDKKFILQAMALYPCGYLPMMENYNLWAAAFEEAYHRPAARNPLARQGMAICHARITSMGILKEVL